MAATRRRVLRKSHFLQACFSVNFSSFFDLSTGLDSAQGPL